MALFGLWALLPAVVEAIELHKVSPEVWIPGSTMDVTFTGKGLTAGKAPQLWTSFPLSSWQLVSKDPFRMRVALPKDAPIGPEWIRVHHERGASGFHRILLDNIVAQHASNQSTLATAQVLEWPCVIAANSLELKSQFYQLAGKNGQRIAFDLWGQRLGSDMDAVLRIMDPEGNELALADNLPTSADCQLSYVYPNDGTIIVECYDVEYRGKLPYRLRIGDLTFSGATYAETDSSVEQEPNDQLGNANVVSLECTMRGRFRFAGDQDVYRLNGQKGIQLSIAPTSRSLGSPSFVCLSLLDSTGKMIASSGMGDQAEETLRHELEQDGVYYLKARDLLNEGSDQHLYSLDISRDFASHTFKLSSDRNHRPGKNLAVIPGGQLNVRVALNPKAEASLSAAIETQSLMISPSTYSEDKKELTVTIDLPEDLQAGDLIPLQISANRQEGSRQVVNPLDVSGQYPSLGSWPRYWQLPVIHAPMTFGALPEMVEASPGEVISLEIPLVWPRESSIDKLTLQLEPTPKGCEPAEDVNFKTPHETAHFTLKSSESTPLGESKVRIHATIESLSQTLEFHSDTIRIRFREPKS